MDYVVYHNRCSDGFTAAFIAKLWYDKNNIPVEFIPTNPNSTPSIPDIKDAVITMIDVVIPREDLINWSKLSQKLIVLDHHKTAYDELKDLKFCHFDMTKCGASLAWQHFFPHEEPPWWVKYTEDRDLGRIYQDDYKETCHDFSKEVNSYLINIEMNFEQYEKYIKNVTLSDAIVTGMSIIKSQDAQIEWILNCKGKTNITFGEEVYYNIPIVNSSVLQSELGNILAREGGIFAIVWYMRYDEKYGPVAQVSLRSVNDFDVSRLARQIIQPTGQKGGGHPKASGFFMNFRSWQSKIGV